uniref:right-handed parallel beta-helix repeat-containing protein n=1 Tax=Shewanella gaetbuli TaxID=220752 RepID=UPI003B591CB1
MHIKSIAQYITLLGIILLQVFFIFPATAQLSIVGDRMLHDGWNGLYIRESSENAWSSVYSDNYSADAWSQRWEIIPVPNKTDVYFLRNHWTNDYLAVPSETQWEKVVTAPHEPSWTSQQWAFERISGDTYNIRNVWTGQYLSSPELANSILRQAPLDGSWQSQEFTIVQLSGATPPPTDYVIKSNLQVSGSPQNRWDSVVGMNLENTLTFNDLTSVSFDVKAYTGQDFWVYLRDAQGADIAAFYNANATSQWETITLNATDFGLSTNATGNEVIASVQFFIGYDASVDTNSDNDFYFEDLVVSSSSGNVQGGRGSVDENGTGWGVGYGQVVSVVTQSDADAVQPSDSWAIRSVSTVNNGNRWDSQTGMTIEYPFHSSTLESVAFDVKSDVAQGFWVYLRDANSNDIGAHYNTYSATEWGRITLQAGDFNNASVANIASIEFFIGHDPNQDSSSSNAFYFDNVIVNSSTGEQQGERGTTDATGTGWFDGVGSGYTNTVVPRSVESEIVPPPSVVAYDIQYQRTGGIDYYVSPNGNDTNSGSQQSPFKTPQHAANIVGPGDRILLLAGTYTSGTYDDVIRLENSGTATNWISIEPAGNGLVLFNVNGNSGVTLDGASYVRVKGLSIKGVADTLTPSEAEALRQQNWYSAELVGVGISSEAREVATDSYVYPHHIIVEDNYVSWFSGGGIGMKRADYILIRNNEVHHCGLYNVWAQSGISVWENHNFDDNKETYRTVITGNRSYENYNHFKFYASSDAVTADSYTDGNGIILDALAIDQGYLNDGAGGIYSGRTLVQNNLTYKNGGKGINIYASDNIDVIHNVSYRNGQHPEIPGEIALGNTKNVRMFNNIVYADNSEPVFFAYQTQNINIKNNIIFKDTAFNSDDNMSLASGTLNVNPQLSAPNMADFTLPSNSPGVDAAIDELLTNEDFNGASRPQGVAADIGAYEQ